MQAKGVCARPTSICSVIFVQPQGKHCNNSIIGIINYCVFLHAVHELFTLHGAVQCQ